MNRTRRMEVVATLLLLLVVSVQSLPSQSLVRVVNVMRHAPQQSIDVYVDTETTARVVGLGYLGYSEHLSLTTGAHEITIHNAGTSEELARVSVAPSKCTIMATLPAALPQT